MNKNTEPLLFEAILADPILSAAILLLSVGVLGLTSGGVVRFVLSAANVEAKSVSEKRKSIRAGSMMTDSGRWELYFMSNRESDGDSRRDTGTVIGKIENILVVFLVLLDAYTALSIIFAGKSIVRKDDMDRGNTTYYLTGTIANFAYSLLWGLSANILIRMLVT